MQSPDEAREAFEIFAELLRKTYGLDPELVLAGAEPRIPSSIFRSKHAPFSALATYLHAERGISLEQVARLLKRNKSFVRASIAKTTIEDTGGYFVSVTEEDEAWEPRFVEGCLKAGITC